MFCFWNSWELCTSECSTINGSGRASQPGGRHGTEHETDMANASFSSPGPLNQRVADASAAIEECHRTLAAERRQNVIGAEVRSMPTTAARKRAVVWTGRQRQTCGRSTSDLAAKARRSMAITSRDQPQAEDTVLRCPLLDMEPGRGGGHVGDA